jgi:nucleoside phosphorylase
MAVAEAMLDKFHETLARMHADDSNAYTLGSISPHNVIMACLPKGGIGNNNAAVVASHILASFPSLRHRFMVSIGGGALGSVDMRLGDIIVGEQVV